MTRETVPCRTCKLLRSPTPSKPGIHRACPSTPQVLSALSGGDTEAVLHQIVEIPSHLQIAFACRLGYPSAPPSKYLRVRREVADFTHYNRYTRRGC